MSTSAQPNAQQAAAPVADTATPVVNIKDPNQKAAILLAASQLDMFVVAVAGDPQGIPERVSKAVKELKESLEAWANE